MAGKKIASWVSICSLVFSMACGGSSSSSGGSSGVVTALSELDDLPRASSAVVDSASASLARSITPDFALTGLTLAETDSSSFGEDSSLAMCLTTNSVKQSFKDMSFADMVLCYMQNSLEAEVNASLDVDIYDGDAHIFRLNTVNDPFAEEDEEAGQMLVKMQISRNESDVITDFKMWACQGGSQIDYVNYQNDGEFSIVKKNAENGNTQESTITGELEEVDGVVAFTSKTLVSEYTSSFEGNSGFGQTTFVQNADSVSISTYETGEHSDGDYENYTYAEAQILNADAMSTVAIGSGAAQYTMSGSHNEGTEEYSEDGTESWDGDSTEVEESNEYLALVEAAVLPDAIEEPTHSFTGDEVFDCDETDAIDLTIDFDSEDVAACNEIQSIDGEYIDCWGTIANGGGGLDTSMFMESCEEDADCASLGEGAVCGGGGEGGNICTVTCATVGSDECDAFEGAIPDDGPVECIDVGEVNVCAY